MRKDILDQLTQALQLHGVAPTYVGRNSPVSVGMFGRRATPTADLLSGRDEATSARIASMASRGLKAPESLTLAEIKSVCASALTQAPNRN